MILHENRLPADDSHDLSFLKKRINLSFRLLQIIGGALRVNCHIHFPFWMVVRLLNSGICSQKH